MSRSSHSKNFSRATMAVVVLCLSVARGISYANNLDDQKRALDLISEFADKICKDIPLESTSESIELNGKGKAEVDVLIKKLVDLGVEGTAKYSSSKSMGVLQSDIAKAIKDSSECKLRVLDILKDKLLTTAAPQSTKGKMTLKNIDASHNGSDGIRIDGYEGDIEMDGIRTEGNGGKGVNVIRPPSPE